MKSKTMTKYQIHMIDAKVIDREDIGLAVQIPVTLQVIEWCPGLGYLPLDSEPEEYFIIVNSECAAVYHTDVSPLEDESGYDHQVVLYSLRDHARYLTNDDGNEWFVDYVFDGQWSRVLNQAAKLYVAYSDTFGLMED